MKTTNTTRFFDELLLTDGRYFTDVEVAIESHEDYTCVYIESEDVCNLLSDADRVRCETTVFEYQRGN